MFVEKTTTKMATKNNTVQLKQDIAATVSLHAMTQHCVI